MLIKKNKAQLAKVAQSLGVKVDSLWTKRELIEAIEMAQEMAENQEDEAEFPEDPVSLPPEAPTPVPIPVSTPTPQPTPPTPPAPTHPAEPSGPKSGQAGRYKVLNTITLPQGAVHEGEVDLTDAQAKSLFAQGAVVHVDDYPAFLASQAKSGVTDVSGLAVKRRVPTGAGRYVATCSITRRRGMEVEVLEMGETYDFTAEEVANLAKQNAIEYPPED